MTILTILILYFHRCPDTDKTFELYIYKNGEKHVQLYYTRKKAAAMPPLFSRPCGQLVGLYPTCLFYSLRHGRLGLIEVFPFLSFFYSPRSITIVLPFGHQGLSLWSLRVFPLVIKVPHLHLHSFEVKCDERTNGPDGITNHVCY